MQSNHGTPSLKPFISDHGRQPTQRWKRVVIGFGAGVGLTLAAGFLFTWLVFDGFEVASEANLPTLQAGDRFLARPTDSPERGDLVVYTRVGDTQETVARVVAIGGDIVEAIRGRLVVNGQLSEEPYLGVGTATLNLGPTQVPAGTVFLLGDNRMNSSDSRVFGSVPVESVSHRVIAIWWPLRRAGRV